MSVVLLKSQMWLRIISALKGRRKTERDGGGLTDKADEKGGRKRRTWAV